MRIFKSLLITFRWWRWKQKTKVFFERKTKWSPPPRFKGIPDRLCSIWWGTTWWYQNKDISCLGLEFVVFVYFNPCKREYKCVWISKRPDNLQFYWHDELTFNAFFYLFRWLWVIYSHLWRYIGFAHKNYLREDIERTNVLHFLLRIWIFVFCFIYKERKLYYFHIYISW